MIFGKPKLYERDPKSLNLETLLLLHNALLAKQLLVCRELKDRYEALTRLSEGLSEESRVTFEKSAKEMKGLSLIMEQVLNQNRAQG